jgi:hypothetical protein
MGRTAATYREGRLFVGIPATPAGRAIGRTQRTAEATPVHDDAASRGFLARAAPVEAEHRLPDNYTVLTGKKLLFSTLHCDPIRFLPFGAVGRGNPDFSTSPAGMKKEGGHEKVVALFA